MSEDTDKPATKQDVKDALEGALKDMRTFVLDRETALIWRVLALQVTLIGTIAGAQWLAFSSQLSQVQNQLSGVQNLVNQLLQHLLK